MIFILDNVAGVSLVLNVCLKNRKKCVNIINKLNTVVIMQVELYINVKFSAELEKITSNI